MHPLLHSPLLQALGYAIINSLWQFALLWLLYFSINSIFKLSTHRKYTAGMVLQFAGFIWFLETLHFYYCQSLLLVHSGLIDHRIYLPALTSTDGTVRQQFFLWVLHSEQFFPYLSIAYLVLLLVLTVRWMYAYSYIQKVRTEGLQDIAINCQVFVQRLSTQLGITRTVDIFLSELVQTPLTIGFLKPLILIPVATINYLTPQQLEAVILHELAHIKRFDYLFNLSLAFIEACLFFNPFMQLIQQQIKKERENCCDDWVMKYDYSAASYARALLQIASHQTHSPVLALKATENNQLLISRIKRIIEKNERTFFNYKHQLLALLVMTIVLSSLSFLSPSQKTGSFGPNRRNKLVLEPIAAKVNNPLFNPVFFLANGPKSVVDKKKKMEETKCLKTKTGALLSNVRSAATTELDPVFVDDEDENSSDNITEKIVTAAAPEATPVITSNAFRGMIKTIVKERLRLPRAHTENRLSEVPPPLKEITEGHFRWLENETSARETHAALEKARIQLKKALRDIRAAKKEGTLVKLRELVTNGIRKIQKEGAASPLASVSGIKMDQLELLEKQIEIAIASISQPAFYVADLTSDVNFTMPPMVYTFSTDEKKHSFSFEYPSKRRVKIVNAPTQSNWTDVRKTSPKVAIADEDDDDSDQLQQDDIRGTDAPPPPPAPVVTKYRTVIKI